MKTTSLSRSSNSSPQSSAAAFPLGIRRILNSHHWLILALAATMTARLQAETLVIDRQITGIVHHYTPPDSISGMPGFASDEILFDSTGLTNVDLDQYQTFKLRLFVPAGQKIVVNHSDSYRSGLNIYYQAGGDSSAHSETAVLEFEDFVGTMPTRDYSLFYIGDSGNVLEFQASEIHPAGGIEFTAMSYSFTPTYNPANSPKNFTRQSSSSLPVFFGYQTTATTDPGPLVSLVAIQTGTLVIDRQITGIIHHYTPPNFFGPGSPGYVNDEILFDTTGLTDVDLDQYQTFKLRLFAPAGQKLTVNHADTYRSGLSIYYHSGGGDSSSRTETATLDFENFTGSMPTRDYSLFYIGDNGNVLNFQASEVYPAGTIGFTAMSYSFQATYNPANNPKDFTQQSSYGWPVNFSHQTTATTDPGPFVSLEAIPGPQIRVEQPQDVVLVDGGSSIGLGPSAVGHSSPAKTFTVRNIGVADLTLSSVATSGGNATEFSVNTTGMATTVSPSGSTTFTVTFTPTAPGDRSTTLQIFSNDGNESPFDITLTGTGLSFTNDTDGDGLSDGAEFQWAALGFNWQVTQTELVNSFMDDANLAGLFTTSQVQALHIDTPLIQRAGTGLFTLTLGLQKSATLQPGSFQPLPFVAEDMQINGGKIEFQFTSPDNAAFFRVEGR